MSTPMNAQVPLIALNAQLLAGEASYRNAGISAYIAHLLEHLPTADQGLRYLIFVGRGTSPAYPRIEVHRAKLPTRHPVVRILWEQTILPWLTRRKNVALLHATAFVGPLLCTRPQIITVHDLSFLRYPHFFHRSNRLYLSTMTRLACHRAKAIIATSNFTAAETTTLLGISPEHIHTIHLGVTPHFRPLPSGAIAHFRQQRHLPDHFLLHVGTLEPRKNLRTLVRAFARLQHPNTHLILVGSKGWLYHQLFAEIEQLGLNEHIHFPGYVPSAELPFWYNAADGFAYISHYEGFGLPVLEALACGVPTLTSNTTSLPEIAGDAALTVPPDDVEAVADGLHRLLTDRALRQQLRQRGPRHAARFTWQATAQRTAQLYRAVLQDRVNTA